MDCRFIKANKAHAKQLKFGTAAIEDSYNLTGYVELYNNTQN